MPICRPMAGSTDCRPLFPAATARDTPNTITKAERDRGGKPVSVFEAGA